MSKPAARTIAWFLALFVLAYLAGAVIGAFAAGVSFTYEALGG